MTTDTGYIVTCQDDQVRHEGTFANLGAAMDWADTGHFCTSVHRYRWATDLDIRPGESMGDASYRNRHGK